MGGVCDCSTHRLSRVSKYALSMVTVAAMMFLMIMEVRACKVIH